jgi:predicted transcriptional regulator
MIKVKIKEYPGFDMGIVANNVFDIRTHLGLSRPDFRRLAGTSEMAVIRLEFGDTHNFWFSTLYKILWLFNQVLVPDSRLTIDDLINRKIDVKDLRLRDH